MSGAVLIERRRQLCIELEILGLGPFPRDGHCRPPASCPGIDRIEVLHTRRIDVAATERHEAPPLAKITGRHNPLTDV